MKTPRRRLVGEGDDQILEWLSPVSDYRNVISICDRCNEFEFAFPLLELQKELAKHNEPVNLALAAAFDDTPVFLEALLSPYFSTSNSAWGGESPGRSGAYKRAYLELGQTKRLRKILRITNNFIAKWSEFSGLDAAIDLVQSEAQIDKSVEAGKRAIAASDFQQGQRLWREAWEDQLFTQVLAAANQKGAKAFCRFNFLVHNGVVFYLNRDWWHSTKGSVSAVGKRLESVNNVKLVRCEVQKTRHGWIPYFGRTREEELGVGWRETGIEVTAPQEWAVHLLNAMRAEK